MRAILILCALASTARAGRTLYGWLPATDTIADGALELPLSIYEHDDLGRTHERSTALALAPALGIRDALELAILVELADRTAIDLAPGTVFTRFGAELRYRPLPRGSAIATVIRAGVSRDVVVRTQIRAELGAAVSYETGPLQLEADTGLVADFNIGHFHREIRPGIGASVRVAGELRIGAELHAELSLDTVTESWAAAGPNLAWAHGHYWLAGALDVGLHAITAAPRFTLGMVW